MVVPSVASISPDYKPGVFLEEEARFCCFHPNHLCPRPVSFSPIRKERENSSPRRPAVVVLSVFTTYIFRPRDISPEAGPIKASEAWYGGMALGSREIIVFLSQLK